MQREHCLWIAIVCFALCLYLLLGCSAGRMNSFDSAAATAHSQMQQAAVAAILTQAAIPLCKVEFQPGVAVTGVTGITCSAPTDYGKLLAVLTQYNSPDGAREIMARAFKDVATAAIYVGGGAYLGGKAIDSLSYLGATAAGAAGTHVTMNGNNNGANLVGNTSITAGGGGTGGAGGTTAGGPGGSAPSISTTGITDNSTRTAAPTVVDTKVVTVKSDPAIIVQPSYPPAAVTK